jgi:hypothetical protein
MHAYTQKQMHSRAEPVLRKREHESSGLEDALNLRPDVQAEMRIAQMFAANAPVQLEIGTGAIIALATTLGLLAVATAMMAYYGRVYTWIWLNAKVRGVALTRPIQDLVTLWNAVPALGVADVLALDGVHGGINIGGVTLIAQNLGARTAADVVRFTNNLPTLSAQQGVDLLTTHAAVAVDNILAAAVTGVWTPQDNFGGRSVTDVGVGEVVDLAVNINPAGITAADLGGLQWVITAGPGAIGGANLAAGTATYTAQGAGNVTLAAQAASAHGAYANANTATLNKATVAPTGVYINFVNWVSRSGPPASQVRFIGQPYSQPADVSFSMMQVREQAVAAVATGYFAYQNGNMHPLGGWAGMRLGNIATGTPVAGTDTIGTNVCGQPYFAGTFTWSIPWEYQAAGVGATAFTTLDHVKAIDAAGNLTLSKGGAVRTSP